MKNGIELIANLQDYLQQDVSLSYIDVKTKQLWGDSPFPAFDRYCIVISPESFQFDLKAFQTLQQSFKLSIICVCKNYHWVDSIFGTSPNTGIIKMVYDTFYSIWKYFYNNRSNLTVTFDELEKDILLKSRREGDNKDFYWWVQIPITCTFKTITFQEVLNEG